jgi:Squalene/phytoene synthase
MTDSYRAPEASHRYVLDGVRESDRDRFLAALFAPEPARRALLALLAFDHELARTSTVTREPMLARIRLQWWRDAVMEAASDAQPRAQPVVEVLSEIIRRHDLAPSRLIDLIDAREDALEAPLDVARVGGGLAELQLDALGVRDAASRAAAHAVMTARLTGEGSERQALLVQARAVRAAIDPAALPVLLPAVLMDRTFSPWRRPLALWWAAKRGRY